ncbi:hypothetical protein MSAN_00913400 [Mycena sanguinolenta]|uniref:Uncharacterized protein n=1 Tax=Mycena sanguinolenta TaxID=230812 RepID=A0A8H6YZC1_9AGAR|nr:hypothetical protein MSAN_00913400 [Mycena sanguinolenta]
MSCDELCDSFASPSSRECFFSWPPPASCRPENLLVSTLNAIPTATLFRRDLHFAPRHNYACGDWNRIGPYLAGGRLACSPIKPCKYWDENTNGKDNSTAGKILALGPSEMNPRRQGCLTSGDAEP